MGTIYTFCSILVLWLRGAQMATSHNSALTSSQCPSKAGWGAPAHSPDCQRKHLQRNSIVKAGTSLENNRPHISDNWACTLISWCRCVLERCLHYQYKSRHTCWHRRWPTASLWSPGDTLIPHCTTWPECTEFHNISISRGGYDSLGIVMLGA
jgi:hypothetical protein